MAGSSKTMKKGGKRKLPDPLSQDKPSKSTRRTNDDVKEKETPSKMVADEVTPLINGVSRQWRSLDLVLSIQSKQLSNHQKVELIYEFLKSRACKEDCEIEHEFYILSMPQLITNLSSWIQSLLFKSEREIRAGDKESEESRLCLDHRCWEVIKFCFEESMRLQVLLSLSRDLLKVFSCVAIYALNSIKSVHTDSKESIFTAMEFQLYNTVNDCIKLIVSSHGRLLNENLDSWAVAVSSVLELVLEVYGDNLEDKDVGILMTQFSCLVLELFAKFVKLHPCRKNAFRDFVDKLLEPLLRLLGLLCDQIRGNNPLMQNLLKLVQEVLSYGLFHSVHLDEYLSFHSTEKYSSSPNGTLENRTIIKSYHRHLFDKLEVFISARKVEALSGVGEMFYLFVDCMRKHKRNSLNAESSRGTEDHSTTHPAKTGNLTSEKRDPLNTAISDLTKSGFDFFVLTLEPFLLDLNRVLQSNLQTGTFMLDVHHILKCVNKILSIMIRESVYSRMEGDFGGACINFFKIIYGLLLSCYSKFNKIWQSKSGIDRFSQVEILNSVSKEFILSVSSFLEIEYELVGDGLVEIWLMILTFLAVAHSSEDSSLISETVDLGCQLLNLYSDLRQVHQAVFTLCRGLRHLMFYLGDDEMRNPELSASNSIFYYDEFAAAGRLLLCSQKFRSAIMHAIKSIPEGQVSGCVQALRDDMSDTLAWMKVGYLVTDEYEFRDANSCKFTAQAELFGIVLSEIYSVILDSLSISAGNSYLTSVSIKNLIVLMQASTSQLIALEQEGADEFLLSVTGITFQSNTMEHRKYFQDKIPLIALFFFRLYTTCRSLYRQTLSLMPPDSSRKMSGAMADFYTAYSGQDCIERADFEDGGYFSWIGEASASLLCAMQFIKDNFLQKGSLDYSSLIYVMLIMALQRLVELNRQIQSLEYIEQRSNNVTQSKSMDETDLLVLPDEKKKLGALLSDSKQEAAGLTGFMMEYLSLIDEEQLFSKLNGKTSHVSSPRYLEVDSWDLGVCTLNEKTLPTAIWWIICQNVDTWCNHVTKKKLKLFVKHLAVSSLPHERCREFQNRNWEPCNAINVTKQQISQEQLQDTTLYDERSVCRYIPSTLCNVFEMYVSVLFEDPSSIDSELSSSDWEKVLSSMSQRAMSASSYSACSDLIDGCCDQQSSSSSIGLPIAACQHLLDLLCHTTEGSLNSKSFSRCMIYLVNCERYVLESLSDPQRKLCLHKYHELLRLLVSCRKALKYLLLTFCEDKSELSKSTRRQKISKSSLPTLWLLKSVSLVVMWRGTSSLGCDGGHVNDIIFSLMNHTSYVFHMFCKYNFGLAIQSVLTPRGDKSILKSPKDVEVYENLTDVVVMLEDQTKSCLLSLKEAFNNGNSDIDAQLTNLNDLCSVAYCAQGFLWGLESTLSDVSASGNNLTKKMLKRRYKTIYGINNFIELFVEFISICSQIFLRDDQSLNTTCEDKEQLDNDIDNDALETEVGSESENENQDGKPGKIPLTSSHVQNDSGSGRRKKRLQSDNVHTCIGGLTEFSLFNYSCLRIEFLQNFLSGQNLESAFLLRGLFIASSAIIRLSTRIGCSLPSNLVQFFLGCSEVLLMKFSCMCDMPKPLSFVWLDGPLKFLETLGAHFPSTSAASTRDVYVKLVKLHLNTIGKCICLQGKGATLVSHDIESSNKLSEGQDSESTPSGLYGLDELKARLRMSFRVLIERPSELHLSSAIQTLQSALVGVQDGCTATYEVKMNSGDGGMVSPLVAAAVDCLDIILEFVKGQKQLDLLNKNINSLIASLINIIVHLQGLTLFYRNPFSDVANKNPDSGSVVVMCVEVLTRIAGKPAMFSLDSQHVAQSLHIPATLFQGFRNLRAVKSFYPSLTGFVDSKELDQLEMCALVDRKFSINLYAASCKLLWTVVKHQKSKCVRFISLLQYSLQALLHCLEIVNVDSTDRKGYFSWQVEEGAKCASYLRRVYEEIRQQKEALGQHCFMFLSDYIWLYSGHGPLKRGIKREVDESLRPGVYALIDVCSADDLQYLHTVFGEGPCRSTLASLQHDYKLHFQYEGKV